MQGARSLFTATLLHAFRSFPHDLGGPAAINLNDRRSTQWSWGTNCRIFGFCQGYEREQITGFYGFRCGWLWGLTMIRPVMQSPWFLQAMHFVDRGCAALWDLGQ